MRWLCSVGSLTLHDGSSSVDDSADGLCEGDIRAARVASAVAPFPSNVMVR